jgi:hypothetical protein
LRFQPPTLRGRYGEESEEGQDREEGQEVKSQEEEVVSRPGRSAQLRPGNLGGKAGTATKTAGTMARLFDSCLVDSETGKRLTGSQVDHSATYRPTNWSAK